jgi:hypothetical protein
MKVIVRSLVIALAVTGAVATSYTSFGEGDRYRQDQRDAGSLLPAQRPQRLRNRWRLVTN